MTVGSCEFESHSLHLMKVESLWMKRFAEIAQLVEHNLAKVGVASSSLVFRSKRSKALGLFFVLNIFRKSYKPQHIVLGLFFFLLDHNLIDEEESTKIAALRLITHVAPFSCAFPSEGLEGDGIVFYNFDIFTLQF